MAAADWKPKFAAAVAKPYYDQAKFWLNAYWKDGGEQEAEKIWVRSLSHHCEMQPPAN